MKNARINKILIFSTLYLTIEDKKEEIISFVR